MGLPKRLQDRVDLFAEKLNLDFLHVKTQETMVTMDHGLDHDRYNNHGNKNNNNIAMVNRPVSPNETMDHGDEYYSFRYSWIDKEPLIQMAYRWGFSANCMTEFVRLLGLDVVKAFILDVERDKTIDCKSRVLLWRFRQAEKRTKQAV